MSDCQNWHLGFLYDDLSEQEERKIYFDLVAQRILIWTVEILNRILSEIQTADGYLFYR